MSEIINNADKIFDKLERDVSDWAKESVEEIKADAIASQNQAKSGRTYKRKGKTYRASAPGESPKRVSGELAASFQTRSSILQASVGTNLKRSQYLENMNRPIFDLSVQRLLPTLGQKLQEAIN